MPDPYTRAFNAREKARQEKNTWKARARKAEQRLAAVRELHREGRNSCCAGGTICDHCEKRWPCPTIQALEGDT